MNKNFLINGRLKILFQIIILTVFLTIIAAHLLSHKDEVSVLRHIEPNHIAKIVLVLLFAYLIYSANLFYIIQKLGMHGLKFIEWFKICTVSRFINFHVMQGANVFQGLKLKAEYQFPYTNSLSMITFFGWFQAVWILIISTVLIAIFHLDMRIAGAQLLPLMLISIVIILAMPFASEYILSKISFKNSKMQWVKNKINEITHNFIVFSTDTRFFIKITTFYILFFICYLTIVELCFSALGMDMRIDKAVVYTTVLMLSRTFNVIPGNLGLTELVCGQLSKLLEGKLSYGILVSGLIRITDYLLVLLLNIVFAKTLLSGIQPAKRKKE